MPRLSLGLGQKANEVREKYPPPTYSTAPAQFPLSLLEKLAKNMQCANAKKVTDLDIYDYDYEYDYVMRL